MAPEIDRKIAVIFASFIFFMPFNIIFQATIKQDLVTKIVI